MNTTQEDRTSKSSGTPPRRRPAMIALTMVVVIGVFYLLREHWNHVAGSWVYLLLLACPLMHLFHGHGGHGGHSQHRPRADQREKMDG